MHSGIGCSRSIAISVEVLSIFTGLSCAIRPARRDLRRISRISQRRYSSSAPSPQTVELLGKSFSKDSWYNLPINITSTLDRKLHLQPDHPIAITRQIIESQFPAPTYAYHNTFSSVVTTHQNFDSLGFPPDHPGRSKSDTYYINNRTLLRTHTSAHQADVFHANQSAGFLISADVYRRDAIDRSHYPVFHQMEGARMWDRKQVHKGDIVRTVWADVDALPKHEMTVEDLNPPTHAERNPLQSAHHTDAEAEAIAAHLKRSLELMINQIFTLARAAASKTTANSTTTIIAEPLKVRWIEAYFPFTSPSWELEIFWQGEWLEVLGCGVVKQELYINAGVPEQIGWAFGIGLERIAMLLFEIPDIRLFWSKDERFLNQFTGVQQDLSKLRRFIPFSKYPGTVRDVSFWLPAPGNPHSDTAQEMIGNTAGGGGSGIDAIIVSSTESDLSSFPSASAHTSTARAAAITSSLPPFHENDVMEIVRAIGGDDVEDVRLLDEFTHPKTGRRSMAYRIHWRSLERTLTRAEANVLHERVKTALVDELGVELR